MSEHEAQGLSAEDLAAERATARPNKEVMSLLDLNADVDLALDLAAPIDLAVAANLNVAAPINAAASANILSFGSESAALADQGVQLDQHNSGEAIADAPQTSSIHQADDVIEPTEPVATEPVPTDGGTVDVPLPLPETSTGGLLDGDLLDVDVDIDADVDAAAPIAGAVAANANVAAPINASVAANVASIDSSATAVAQQTAIINQDLDGAVADATAAQDSEIIQ
jgi:hypothetical protein